MVAFVAILMLAVVWALCLVIRRSLQYPASVMGEP